MPHDTQQKKNWFDQGGNSYALYRPDYPPELSIFLAQVSPNKEVAVDVGCGNGQLTVQLAEHFSKVVGTDPSIDQIAHAMPHDHVAYFCAPAEKLPVADNSADLITAAQAAHWFDMHAFCDEVQRVARPGAAVALITYGVLDIEGEEVNQVVQNFYHHVIGPYWPPARRHVENGYRDLHFPFQQIEAPSMAIQRAWRLSDLVGYIDTWSAVKATEKARGRIIITDFYQSLADYWSDPQSPRQITWPLSLRVGKV